MVWTQASGWNGQSWDAIDIMKAPYTTDPQQTQPMKVRTAPGGTGLCSPWRVGAGYATTRMLIGKQQSAQAHHVFLVRLSDGVLWQVPERAQRHFAVPLFVNAQEVTLPEELDVGNDAGVTEFQSWSIVRYPISLLGPGTPP